MGKKLKWIIPLVLLILIAAFYLKPTQNRSFEEIYANVDAETVASLQDFREAHPVQKLEVNGVTWDYIAMGEGEETILFLHGMTGA